MPTPRVDQGSERPLEGLAQTVSEQAVVLARQQVELARRGLMTKATEAGPGVAMLGGAAVLAVLASGTGTAALVLLVARRPGASAALGVTGAYAGAGALLARQGLGRLRKAGSLISEDAVEKAASEDVVHGSRDDVTACSSISAIAHGCGSAGVMRTATTVRPSRPRRQLGTSSRPPDRRADVGRPPRSPLGARPGTRAGRNLSRAPRASSRSAGRGERRGRPPKPYGSGRVQDLAAFVTGAPPDEPVLAAATAERPANRALRIGRRAQHHLTLRTNAQRMNRSPVPGLPPRTPRTLFSLGFCWLEPRRPRLPIVWS